MKLLLLASFVASELLDVRLSIERKIWTGRTEYFIDLVVDDRNVWHCNLDARTGFECKSGAGKLTLLQATDAHLATAVAWNGHTFACTAPAVSDRDSWLTPRYTKYVCTAQIE